MPPAIVTRTCTRTNKIAIERLKGIRSLDEVSFEEKPITGIFGPNGNGKSTILHALAAAYQAPAHASGRNYREFFPKLDHDIWNGTRFTVTHSGTLSTGGTFADAEEHYSKGTITTRWHPLEGRRPIREVVFLGVKSCLPALEQYASHDLSTAVYSQLANRPAQRALEALGRILNGNYQSASSITLPNQPARSYISFDRTRYTRLNFRSMHHFPNITFLKESVEALRTREGIRVTREASGSDGMLLSYRPPEGTNGVSYIINSNFWDGPVLYGDSTRDLVLELRHDGTGYLFSDDESSFLLRVALRGGHEILDLLEFFETASPEEIERNKPRAYTFKELIEGLYLMLPVAESCVLLKFNWTEWVKEKSPFFEQLLKHSSCKYFNQWDHLNQSFGDWAREHSSDWQGMATCIPLKGDLVWNSDAVLRFEDYMIRCGTAWDDSPRLIIRPKSTTSSLLLADILAESKEACEFTSSLAFCMWDRLASLMKTTTVNIPQGKVAQTGASIEIRTAIQDYGIVFQHLIRRKNAFQDVKSLYERRTHCLAVVHEDLLAEVEALHTPFPFFLEHPIRQFIAASDPLQKINQGQVLLNLLIKLPVFLILEEAALDPCDIALRYMNELRERPLSEGSLIDIRRRLSSDLKGMKRPTTIFQELEEHLEDLELLGRLVEARNRFHHPPFDDAAFLDELTKGLPSYIAGLRPAFKSLIFLVPKTLEYRNGKGLVTASNISGSNTVFPSFAFETRLPLESFPSETLVCWNRTSDRSVSFKRLLTIRKFKTEAIDIGIFDRIRNNEPQFSFAREG